MRKIKITKIEVVELEVLQGQLVNFITYKNSILLGLKNTDQYFSSVLLIDISRNLALAFRRLIENNNTGLATLNLSASEACVLMQCTSNNSKYTSHFENYVMQKFTGILHKELTNLI